MWGRGADWSEKAQARERIRTENNIMALRRARYGMLTVCENFARANGKRLTLPEEEMIICRDEYLSNSDEE